MTFQELKKILKENPARIYEKNLELGIFIETFDANFKINFCKLSFNMEFFEEDNKKIYTENDYFVVQSKFGAVYLKVFS